jgi:hypothetical protein
VVNALGHFRSPIIEGRPLRPEQAGDQLLLWWDASLNLQTTGLVNLTSLLAVDLAASTTCVPRAAIARARASPMPDEAPVITAIRCVFLMVMFSSSLIRATPGGPSRWWVSQRGTSPQ